VIGRARLGLDAAATAIGFLTRIPVPALPASARESPSAGSARESPSLSDAALFFPLVGLLVGGTGALVRLLVGDALSRDAATVAALAAMVIVTGGLHEDGLADTADALAPHTTRERRLEIMRDPRVGSFGVLALVLTLLFAFTLLAPLDDGRFAQVVLVAHVLARWSMLALALFVGAARADGLGSQFRPGAASVLVASAYTVGIALWVGGAADGAEALGLAVLVTFVGGFVASRALGGVTGDVYGATNKLVELVAYAALV
jgi:adenosylcobinamide-GDP ribazoletransferase